ncbi:MAG: tetratricopeptide repeat protein [Spirochaetaceae bacterium]|nr:tetratricopeptide repeat protein [Spirochaetaceae bacterium]
MTVENDPLESLVWIDLPDDMDTDIGPFKLDTSIPLPVEPDTEGQMNIADVTWEKVIAAILLILGNRPTHEHAAYYRVFLAALRPDLDIELAEASRDCISRGEWSKAEDLLLALRGLKPESVEPRFIMARYYDNRSEYEFKSGETDLAETYGEAAEAAYSEVLSDDSAPIEAWYEAGIFRYRRGDFLRAAESLESFLSSDPDGEERKTAERLVRLCRDDGQADEVYRRAYDALTHGRISEGVSLAQDFRSKKPEGWPGWFLLGWGLRLSEDWQEAREVLEGARERGCRESELFNELAICTRALKDFQGASDALQEALQRDPENIKIISNMAIVEMEQGHRDEAVRWLQTALTLEPEDAICRQLLAEVESDE